MRVLPDEVLLALNTWMEAEGEPFEGKVAVAEVHLNRISSGIASDGTVAGTIVRPFQFSGWNIDAKDRARLAKALQLDDQDPAFIECEKAVHLANTGTSYAHGATHYCRVEISNRWTNTMRRVATIGNHAFYKAIG